jgi:hypothetical protein
MSLLYRVYIKADIRPVVIRISSAGAERQGSVAVRAGCDTIHEV